MKKTLRHCVPIQGCGQYLRLQDNEKVGLMMALDQLHPGHKFQVHGEGPVNRQEEKMTRIECPKYNSKPWLRQLGTTKGWKSSKHKKCKL
mmetsp:Transcript_10845/g.30881  ORF Transcript_10845/g.30881 Transcript_10845/m.30881 type:complete len:90 (+) Transcript_10845:259-528(+)